VIPVKIFQELDYISTLMSTQIKEFEVKVSKEFLKENILEKARYELAKKTHEITLLTEGMLKLDKTLMGVIELDPKKVLVIGLRNELCRKLAEILHN
jgi:WASH complex subunit strumpellin